MIKLLQRYFKIYYRTCIRPNSANEDLARREYIFNILMTGFLFLSIIASLVSLTRYISNGSSSENISPYILILTVLLLFVLYLLSRIKYNFTIVYIFVGLFALLGTYGLYLYSFALSQGLLIYTLVIIMSGILISPRAAIIVTSLLSMILTVLAYLQINHILHPYTGGLTGPFKAQDLLVYLTILLIIFLISWLSSREIEASLQRARNSEKQLRAERDLLESKVIKRTKELEKAQVEKNMELYRFAEFGRLSSSLLHDLSNPLTAVSLTFGQLESNQDSAATIQVRDGITHMEQYVHSARRQLRSQSEIKPFNSMQAIEKVISFLSSKAREHKVKLIRNLDDFGVIYGDSVKFSQIIANLVANAIDSYAQLEKSDNRSVTITSKIDNKLKAIEILVQDNGVGIPKNELNHIFEAFYTTKVSDRGTGIGLTITKRIIEEDFGGTINVETFGRNGAVFKVTLPLNTPGKTKK